MTDHTLFTFLAAKAFSSGNIKICEMLVEWLADEWIATSSPMFATEWAWLSQISRCPFLMTISVASLLVVGLGIFVSTM